jgi:hypothetical protein
MFIMAVLKYVLPMAQSTAFIVIKPFIDEGFSQTQQ